MTSASLDPHLAPSAPAAGALLGARVLIIMGRVPWPIDDGWKMRSGNILKELAAKGARVDLLAFGDPDAPVDPAFVASLDRLERVPRRRAYAPSDLARGVVGATPFSVLNYADDAFAERAQALGRERRYDLVLVEDVVMAQYAAHVDAPVKFLDMHNVESHLLRRYATHERSLPRRAYAALTAAKLDRYEQTISRTFDEVLVCSAHDRDRLRGGGLDAPVTVVPNGIDPAYFAGARPEPPDGSIVFVGSMDYHANVTGVVHFVREILPRITVRLPERRLYIVGKSPTREVLALASDRVVVTGAVDDVRPYVARAGVAVVPLLVGGGTRLKILEAMVMAKAIVSTTVGCEGIDVEDGVTIALADEPQAFADRVVELLHDPAAAEAMGARARAFVLRHYVWNAIVDRIVHAYAARRASSPGRRPPSSHTPSA